MPRKRYHQGIAVESSRKNFAKREKKGKREAQLKRSICFTLNLLERRERERSER